MAKTTNKTKSKNDEIVKKEIETKKEQEIVEETTNVPDFDVVKPFTKDDEPIDVSIENLRKDIKKLTNKSTRLSTISMTAVFLLLGGGFILLGINKVISIILFVVAAVTLLVFFVIIKKLAKPDIKGYVHDISLLIDKFTFTDSKMSDVKYYKDAKLDYSEISNDSLYNDVGEIVSRNVVECLYNKKSMKVCELAIFKKQKGRNRQTNFIGKYLTLTNKLEFSGKFIITVTGKEDVDVLNGISDLKCVFEEDNIKIYSDSSSNYKKVLPAKFLAALKNIKIDEYLLKDTFVIWGGQTRLYSSYADEVITLPFNKPVNMQALEKYRKDLLESLDMNNLL